MRSLFKNPFNSPMRSPTAEESYAFKLHLTPGALPYDEVTNVPASCSISGVRYGLVNGIVSSFASNMPPVEDKGLRGCPAFTQLAKMTETLTDASWVKSNGLLAPTLAGTFQGQNVWNCPESTTTSAYHTIGQNVGLSALSDNSIVGMALVVKYSGRKLSIVLLTKANTYVSARFNLQTGVVEVNTGLHASIISLGSGYYYIFFAASLLTGATSPSLYAQILENNISQYTGDGVSGVLIGQPTYINFGVNGIPFIPPYVPNNTGSSVSVVSEAATSSTGTSFDLDAATLTSLKKGLRGKAVGEELTNPTTVETQNIDANNYTSVTGDVYTIVSSGTYCQFSWPNKLTIGKTYEFLPTIIGTPIGSIKEQSTNTVLTHGVPIMVTATGTQIAVARATACNVSLRLSVREVQAQGHIELEFESNVDLRWLPSGSTTFLNVFSVANNQIFGSLYFKKEPFGVLFCKLHDGTNNPPYVTISTLTVGQTFKISLDYGTYTDGSQKMCLTVNGVKSIVGAFPGSFGTQDLRFFFGNTVHAGWIRNLSYSEKPVW